jgi:hypothetical protein
MGTWVGVFLQSLVMMSPYFVVDLIGAILALVWWRRHPRVSLLTLLATIGLALLVGVGGSFVLAWLPDHLRQRGWKFEQTIALFSVLVLITGPDKTPVFLYGHAPFGGFVRACKECLRSHRLRPAAECGLY